LRRAGSKTLPSQLAEGSKHILVSVNALRLSTRNELGAEPVRPRNPQIPLQSLTCEVALGKVAGGTLLLKFLIQFVRDSKRYGSHVLRCNTLEGVRKSLRRRAPSERLTAQHILERGVLRSHCRILLLEVRSLPGAGLEPARPCGRGIFLPATAFAAESCDSFGVWTFSLPWFGAV
jgi:hypothetical protein